MVAMTIREIEERILAHLDAQGVTACNRIVYAWDRQHYAAVPRPCIRPLGHLGACSAIAPGSTRHRPTISLSAENL